MKKWNYYNDSDPKACAWARELIKAGLVPDGEVDCRSITEVQPEDLRGFVQCHFFSGILGWSLALRLAGVPDNQPVWTGSCPCQPFSAAGKQLGTADERHLWPAFFRLIAQCRPELIFGEQVANAIGKGWLDGISADLDSEGYTCGAAVLGAHSIGAPHIRQRLFWVADTRHEHEGRAARSKEEESRRALSQSSGRCDDCRLEHSMREGRKGQSLGLLGSGNQGNWSNYDLLPCLDGKARRVESGTFPLAHGVSGRVGLLRGYGNAIVPALAAEFIAASMEAIQEALL